MAGGTGQKFAAATTVVAGVASLAATLMSIVSIWLQTKNYRKPLLQRYVVRILLMVPIYSIASFSSMVSLELAQFLDPIRDIYEAFTIYTFFQLLINYLGGERNLIIMMHGREPVRHLWPLNHCLGRVDMSDPYTFLAVKRGILQYAWLKPILSIAAIVMKATGTYQEGYIGLNSGYLWSGLIYNVSVTVSLYSLGLFWVCMAQDLKPFRPMPKFLCIKLVIFASYWQGFMLSILVWAGALPDDVQGYAPDNLAAAIQDALICIEMPVFAVAHWYAFSWHDFADNSVSSARMPVRYALRDAFGIRDLVQDSRETFSGDKYAYRAFDSGDKIMAHEASRSRLARLQAGMRYERGGKGKYWIPRPGEGASNAEVDPYTPLLGGGATTANGGPSRSSSSSPGNSTNDEITVSLDPDEEALYDTARKLEYGDWNYPVIPANLPSREDLWAQYPSSYQQPSAGKSNPALPEETVVRSKRKGKQRQGVPTSSGSRTSPRGTPRPGVQMADKPDLDDTDALDASKGPSEPPAPQEESSRNSPGAEEAQNWERHDHPPVPVSPHYDVDEDEGFGNVWSDGSGEQSEQQPHL